MIQALQRQLLITPWQCLAVVVGTSILFWFFTVLMSITGQRMGVRVTATSVALMAVIGSVTARAMVGPYPTVVTGVLVLLTVFAWEAVFRLLDARFHILARIVRRSRVVMRNGVIDYPGLKAARIRESDLMVRLRRKGVLSMNDLQLVIVEANGALTILRTGQTMDEVLLAGVVGIEGSRTGLD